MQAEFSASLLQSSVSHKIILKGTFYFILLQFNWRIVNSIGVENKIKK